MAETTTRVNAERPKIYSHELIELILRRPYCRISDVVESGIVGRQAASRYLKALVSMGVLEEQRSGREVLFVNRRITSLLTT